MCSCSLALVGLQAWHRKNFDVSCPYVDLRTLVQKPGMKNFSFHAFAFYYAACLRKKVVSCPDDLLVVERKRCSSMTSILHSSRDFGNERKATPMSNNFIRMALLVSLENADDV